MAGYLIAETTREDREKIVAEPLEILMRTATVVWQGLAEMYQEYIEWEERASPDQYGI